MPHNNQPVMVSEDRKAEIRKLFRAWQAEEIRNKHYWAHDSCNMNYFNNHSMPDSTGPDWGFPDSSEISFSFACLNEDTTLDGLVTFNPVQCDGGNGSMWTQVQVFILSGKDGYRVTDTIALEKFASTEFDSLGFYWIDSIGRHTLYGTYTEFSEDDPHCCPSINRPVVFDFVERKLVSIGEKKDELHGK